MTRAQMNWKIIRSLIPIIGLWIIVNSTKDLTETYKPTKPILKTTAQDLVWRFQVNEGDFLLGKTVEISGIVTSLDSIYAFLDQRVFFSMDSSKNKFIKYGEKINIIARCANFEKKNGILKIDHVTFL